MSEIICPRCDGDGLDRTRTVSLGVDSGQPVATWADCPRCLGLGHIAPPVEMWISTRPQDWEPTARALLFPEQRQRC